MGVVSPSCCLSFTQLIFFVMKAVQTIFIVWISIYPTITLLLWGFGAQLQALPLPLRTLVLTVILVPLMVLVLVPFWTRQIEARKAQWQHWRAQS